MGQSWAEGMDVQLRSQEVLACGCGNSLKNSKLWSFVMLCVLERHSWQGMEAALERERREGDRQEMAMTVLVGHGAWLRQRWAQGERCLLHWTDRTRECQLVTISASKDAIYGGKISDGPGLRSSNIFALVHLRRIFLKLHDLLLHFPIVT